MLGSVFTPRLLEPNKRAETTAPNMATTLRLTSPKTRTCEMLWLFFLGRLFNRHTHIHNLICPKPTYESSGYRAIGHIGSLA